MIILVRHAQSEGNKNRAIHQTVPDHRVSLTPEGWRQAAEAGLRLRSLLQPDDTLHFFTSPYRRTRETTEGILDALTSDDPSPSPFPRHAIKVYEEPRLREQDFGNFQPSSAEMERMWHERADYGHFFYRIPNGESAADAYDRISGFNESLWRLFGEDDCASVHILVTHGLMTRVFLMKWYHFSVEYFEDLRNVDHCEFVIMTKNPDNGKYILQNKLRTWSELKLERALAAGSSPTTTRRETYIPERRWGGIGSAEERDAKRSKEDSASDESSGRPRRDGDYTAALSVHHASSLHAAQSSSGRPNKPRLFSPERDYLCQSGRDFGGSMSGAASRNPSPDGDGSSDGGGCGGGGHASSKDKGSPAMTRTRGLSEQEKQREEALGPFSRPEADALGDHQRAEDAFDGTVDQVRRQNEAENESAADVGLVDAELDSGEDDHGTEEPESKKEPPPADEAWDKSIPGSVY